MHRTLVVAIVAIMFVPTWSAAGESKVTFSSPAVAGPTASIEGSQWVLIILRTSDVAAGGIEFRSTVNRTDFHQTKLDWNNLMDFPMDLPSEQSTLPDLKAHLRSRGIGSVYIEANQLTSFVDE